MEGEAFLKTLRFAAYGAAQLGLTPESVRGNEVLMNHCLAVAVKAGEEKVNLWVESQRLPWE